jgi:hypothetical protein
MLLLLTMMADNDVGIRAETRAVLYVQNTPMQHFYPNAAARNDIALIGTDDISSIRIQ